MPVNVISIQLPYFTLVKLFTLTPATKKYIAVLMKAKRVDWFASVVLCKANFSRSIKSLFIISVCIEFCTIG